MDTALGFVIALLVVLLVLFLLFYVVTQQDLRSIHARLVSMDPPARPESQRSVEAVRLEKSAAHDKIVLLEADLATNPREALTPEELSTYEESRRIILARNMELKRMKDWMGLPFDLEWTDIQQRLPKVTGLYRQAVTEATEQEAGAR